MSKTQLLHVFQKNLLLLTMSHEELRSILKKYFGLLFYQVFKVGLHKPILGLSSKKVNVCAKPSHLADTQCVDFGCYCLTIENFEEESYVSNWK